MKPTERKAKQELILTALGKCASIKQACTIAGIDRTTFYRWKESNKQFAQLVAEAEDDANDTIDDEIVRRAILGIEEPLVSMGRVVCEEVAVFDAEGNEVLDRNGNPKTRRGSQLTVRKYSDALLLAIAKSRMAKYRDKGQLAITGKDEGPVDVIVETFWGRGTDPRRKFPEAFEPAKEVEDPAETIEEDQGGGGEFSIEVPDDGDE